MLEMKYVSAVAHADEVKEFKTWTRTEVKKAPASITIGDIKVILRSTIVIAFMIPTCFL